MVVMKYIDAKTAHQQHCNQQLPQPIFNQIEEPLGILHVKNIVFADIRHPNIMTKGTTSHVFLLNFPRIFIFRLFLIYFPQSWKSGSKQYSILYLAFMNNS